MHYLRWQAPVTPGGLEQAGMDYDSTPGYADHAGLRCGTCREYPAFDLTRKTALRLRLQPLIVMECTVMASRYMDLAVTHDAYEKIRSLAQTCQTVNGTFTLLWHNTELCCPAKRNIYEHLLTESRG